MSRRRLPMVEFGPTVSVVGPNGAVPFLDLFEGRDEPTGLAGGFTDRYVTVLAPSEENLRFRLLPVRVSGRTPDTLLGTLA